jgi:methionine-rich copper-binding protein CopC
MPHVLKFLKSKTCACHFSLFSLMLTLAFSPLSWAQHEIHNMPADGTHVQTMPENDAVLASAPASIMLQFESEVQLVNLALREPSQGKEIIDIGFRYRLGRSGHFEHPLPVLLDADYYVAEWTIINANGRLMKGAFYFSFGDDAKPPSTYLDQMNHEMQIISPDYRLL